VSNENAHFEKVLNVAEKSVEAWSKAYNKIEDLSKDIDRLVQEFKDLDNLIRQKPCINDTAQYAQLESKVLSQCVDIKDQLESLNKKFEEFEKDKKDASKIESKVTLWLKLATGAFILIGSILGALVALFK
jgi:septation ring formation regulator EzrA